MSPKQQRGEATVEQVMDAALSIYASSGEAGLTLGAITKASGVSSGSIYHHFGSLDGVLSALALRALGQLLSALGTALTQATHARSGIQAVVLAYLDFVQTHPEEASLLHSVAADREGMARAGQIRDSQEARLAPIALWIHAHQESGELVKLSAPMIESLVLGPVVAVVRRWLTVGDIDMEEAARALPDHIWRSVSHT
ncbi:TetR/AcrR family transcriptional regulator [Streptomyces sp. ISL-44]|uniref:TetR/AcrR family transcriptional regulator n=1 Tax=unclassified Streptomyces TaxID=2593676 RepID=UPI001BEB0BDC|nr:MULTISPECIES: TetR/AcrR family transcriptional regulator [unclassified Streptomyces]MBT2545018.1 TetR/AcrR family transcriptional regulator [Streptomyces sp. ISL-44]MCX5009705.1 TetR/AcrR family transcriptional regulator [Streptomyces sp. NBC_00555]MCX5612737.1 TetR/AcrR family transcriptional regulator [Streptomyces sp. NBC_00047]UUU38116.1 TetR/AcrR family transcriptional regulator [Streptomyces sp. NBC_00162]